MDENDISIAFDNHSFDQTRYNNNKDKSCDKIKIPYKLLKEFKYFSDFIFSDKVSFIENFQPKNKILYDNSLFSKCKCLIYYEMETIFSYTPKNKKINSSSNEKKTEKQNLVKCNKDQKLNQNQSHKIDPKKDEISVNNGVDSVSDNKYTSKSCFDLFNSGFFCNQVFKDNTNTNNIRFLNTKKFK